MIIVQSVNEHATHNVVSGKKIGPSRGMMMEVKFVKDKETKNTIRFTAVQDSTGGEISGSIYVAKTSDLASQTEFILEFGEKVEA